MTRTLLHLLLLTSLFLLDGCGTQHSTGKLVRVTERADGTGTKSLAPALVYKTRMDYYNRVPVLMSPEKDRIIAYPDPSDLLLNGQPALPTRLDGGYLLDNRGIGSNVAFLTYTYDAYLRLKQVPTMQQLMDSLLDRNPLTELWDCGPRSLYRDEATDLNTLIHKGFPGLKALVEKLSVTLKNAQP